MRRHKRASGFTLIEMAIVVGVAGLLFSGLWRLIASGNSQLREQVAADQINQVITATRSFLATDQGQNLLRANMDAAAGTRVIELRLPASAANAAGLGTCGAALTAAQGATVDKYCSFLPSGFFVGAGGAVNSFNQSYRVYVRKLDGAVNVAPQNYDFIVFTTGGDTISDPSGGRIAANIGASGGFIYTDTVCGGAGNACGAFGGFTIAAATLTAAAPAGLGIATPGAGHIITLNGSAANNNTNGNWLARILIPGDSAAYPTNIFNTMTVDMHMQPTARINMHNSMLNLNDGIANGTGRINLDNGIIQGNGSINIRPSAVTDPVPLNVTNQNLAMNAALIRGRTDCDIIVDPLNCFPALQVSGSQQIAKDLNIFGFGKADQFQANTFIYSSDIRMKRAMQPLENALEKISRLHGYQFEWRQGGRTDIGLMAQEVEKVFPQLVHKTSDGHLGVEYGNLVAPMIEAIKELRRENMELRQQLQRQQRAIDRLGEKLP